MKLNDSVFSDPAFLRAKGYAMPEFDVSEMRARTYANPQWAHFGPGNIFRASPG